MRQILVKKTKHTDELSFNTVKLRSKVEWCFTVGEVDVLDLDLDIETINVLEKQDLNFIWTINPRLAGLGAMLLGTEIVEGKVRAYISTVKEFAIQKDYPVLIGKVVMTMVLRQVDDIGGVLDLNRSGKEL